MTKRNDTPSEEYVKGWMDRGRRKVKGFGFERPPVKPPDKKFEAKIIERDKQIFREFADVLREKEKESNKEE